MNVIYEANVRITNGQLFQVTVDGAVATSGNITVPKSTNNLVVPLSPGKHTVSFVYTWTNPNLSGLPTTSNGIVKIYSVELPQIDPQFPTFSPTGVPSTSPSTLPSRYPSVSPTAMPSSSPTTSPPTESPTVSPTLSPTVSTYISHIIFELCFVNVYVSSSFPLPLFSFRLRPP